MSLATMYIKLKSDYEKLEEENKKLKSENEELRDKILAFDLDKTRIETSTICRSNAECKCKSCQYYTGIQVYNV